MTASQIYARRWWTLGVLSLSLFVIGLDNTILNVALPSLVGDLDASAGQLQWIVDSYILVFAGLLLTLGSLGDRFGHKKLLTGGLLIFGLGSALSAVASSAEMLIGTRALMGVGGAAIMPATLSVITHVFPAGERGKAIGIWAAVSGLGIAIGPVAGGWLLEHFDWGAVFWVNVPVVIAAVVLGRSLVPMTRDAGATRLDPVGAGLSIAGLGALVWGIIETHERGWGDPLVLGAFVGSVVVLGLFAAWELRRDAPMLDLRLFRNRAFSAAGGAIALIFFALFGTVFLTTQYLQSVQGLDALEAGIRILPVAAGIIVGGPLSAKLSERFGARAVITAGMTVITAGLFVLAGLEVDSAYATFALGIGTLGLGMGLSMTPATDAIMGTLPLEKSGVGSATNDTVRQIGGALGVAVLGSLLASGYGADMEAATEGLPATAAHVASDTIGGAEQVAATLPAQSGDALMAAASEAFVNAMHTSVLVAAGAALLGALLAWGVMPRRERRTETAPVAVPAGAAA
jgi:EmrB/QacA subfamily drug resistance transporter